MNRPPARSAPDRLSFVATITAGFLLLIAPAFAQEAVAPTSPTTTEPGSTTPGYAVPSDITTTAPPAPAPAGSPAEITTTAPSNSPINATPDSNLHVAGATPGSEVSAEPRRFQYGLQITVRGVYDDNINISSSGRVSDFYVAIEPVLTLGFGDIIGHQSNYLRLDYAPGLFIFADHSEADAFQQLIHLEGQHQFSRLTLNLAEQIAILKGTDLRSLANQNSPGSNANIDVGQRTEFQTYDTKLGASYDLSGKTFVSLGADSLITEYNSANFFSSENISGNLFLNYRYGDKIVVGLGGTGGYDVVGGPNPNQTYEQANVRLSYQATGKISLNGSAGVEFRQFENNSRGQYVSPVYELSLNYQPTDSTSFSLSGNRRTNNSGVLVAQDFASTNIQASLQQRFLQRFFVGVTAGYQNDHYFSTVNGLVTNRNDDYTFIEPSLDFRITRFWFIGGYYLHRQNDSTFQPFSFKDNQTGFRTALVF